MHTVHQSLRIPGAGVTLEADIVVPDPALGVVLFANGRVAALTDWLVDQEQTDDLVVGCSAPAPARPADRDHAAARF
jgi:hypothetical protein